MRVTAAGVLAVLAFGARVPAEPGDAGAKTVDAMIVDLGDEDPEVRLAAREGLRDAGEAARGALENIAGGGDTPLARQARAVLRKLDFDRRAAAAIGGGVSWFRWERKGATVWVRLEARRRAGKDGGWTLVETLFTGDVRLTQRVETDRDFSPRTIVSTLGDGETKNEVKAEFRDGKCVIEERGKKDELPGDGVPWTDWTVVRFAGAILADPPREPEIVIWDTPEQEPATTKLQLGEPEITDGPGGARLRARPVKVEGLLTAWVLEDGTLSHATFGEGSLVTPAAEKDVPEDLKK
ncbi:MAG: hypothetical protein IT452_18330 [Planctomycetia bacterium]|nr:hypothetical protein [Planctomycetia bacterium]